MSLCKVSYKVSRLTPTPIAAYHSLIVLKSVTWLHCHLEAKNLESYFVSNNKKKKAVWFASSP